MKKILGLLICLMLTISITGCGNKETKNDSDLSENYWTNNYVFESFRENEMPDKVYSKYSSFGETSTFIKSVIDEEGVLKHEVCLNYNNKLFCAKPKFWLDNDSTGARTTNYLCRQMEEALGEKYTDTSYNSDTAICKYGEAYCKATSTGDVICYDGKNDCDVTKNGVAFCGINNKRVIEEQKESQNLGKIGGAVYFDPVSDKPCNENTYSINKILKENSTCYKWRVIGIDNDDLTIQLDHNLVNFTAWNTWVESTGNVAGPIQVMKDLAEATKNWNRVKPLNYEYDTSGAKSNYGKLSCVNGECELTAKNLKISNVKARIITAEEIVGLTLQEAPNSSVLKKWTLRNASIVSFSNLKFSQETQEEGNGNTNLSWLIENTTANINSSSTDNNFDDNNLGYWTLSPFSNGWRYAWKVTSAGELSFYYTEDRSFGARPVITIKKSEI